MTLRGPRTLACLALAVILGTTLRAAPSQAAQVAETAWSCLVCGDAGATDVLLNLLLFAPLGIALRLLGWSTRRAVVAMLLLTIGIEVTQATLLSGRDASLGDILANTLGGAAGHAALPALERLRRPGVSLSRGLATLLLGAATATWLATGVGFRPAGSTVAPWVGQPLHQWPNHDPFPGTLDAATVNGVDIPNDPLAAVPSLGSGVRLTLHLTRRDAETPVRPVSLLRVVDGVGKPQLGVTQRGEALLVSVHARASAWRVRTPTWRFDGAMAVPPGAPWQMEWQWRAGQIELRSGPLGATTPAVRTIPVSIGLGWAFVHPFAAPIGPPTTAWWTVVWLAPWGLPIGWCVGWLPRLETVVGVALTLAAYVAASVMTGLPVRPWEVGVLMAWVAAGILLEKREARSEKRGPAGESLR